MNDNRKVVTNDPNEALKIMAEIYQSRFIGLKDMKEAGKPVTMKIKNVMVEELSSIMLDGRRIDGGEKGILIFDRPVGKKNELILNKTSFRLLKREWGDDPAHWIGSTVKIELGKVNGKEACLVSPIEAAKKSGGVPAPSSSGSPKTADDDLDFPEDEIPT